MWSSHLRTEVQSVKYEGLHSFTKIVYGITLYGCVTYGLSFFIYPVAVISVWVAVGCDVCGLASGSYYMANCVVVRLNPFRPTEK